MSTQSPLDVLREAVDEAASHQEWLGYASSRKRAAIYRAALAQVQTLVDAMGPLFQLAAVAHEGDPWYAENADLDGEAILAKASAALASFRPDARTGDRL